MTPVTVVEITRRLPVIPATAGEVIGSLPVTTVTVVEVTRRLAMIPATDGEVIPTLATTTPAAGLCVRTHHRDTKNEPARRPR